MILHEDSVYFDLDKTYARHRQLHKLNIFATTILAQKQTLNKSNRKSHKKQLKKEIKHPLGKIIIHLQVNTC